MSAFTIATRRVATQIPRAAAASAPRAAFSSSVTLQKSIAETVKDTLNTVNRAVSDKALDGIDIGCTYPSFHTKNPLSFSPPPY